MPIDSNIYFQQQAPDLVGSFTKGLQLKDMLGKQKVAEKEQAEKDAYNKAMSESYVTGEDGKTHFSGDMAVKKMRDMALGSKAYEMEKQFKADALSDLKLKQTQANDFSNFMGNANYSLQKNPNQQTYDTILKDAASRGYDTSKMPAQYSPYAQQMMDIYHGQAIGAQKQIENQFNQHKSDREDQQFEFDQKDKNEKRRQDQEKIGIERDKLKADKASGDKLPIDVKKQVDTLAAKNANKIAIKNQIDAVMGQWDSLPEDQKVAAGRQLLKTLNSTEGADAIGAEEAKRLGSKLEFAMGNFTNSNPTQLGRDLKGFKEQAENTSRAIGDAVKTNQDIIDQSMGRKPKAQKTGQVFKTDQIDWAD